MPELDRRTFLKVAGSAAAGAAGLASGGPMAHAAAAGKSPETLVKALYSTLTPGQREQICLPWSDRRRSLVQANWAIVDAQIGSRFTADQKELIAEILRGFTSEQWYARVLAQMKDDAGGLDNYHVALFGSPLEEQFEWVLTGRHVTFRVDGHTDRNAAFGGPIFYGHAVKFTEDPGHPGNIYWEQGRKANSVFQALDPKQRAMALLPQAPDESMIRLQGRAGQFPGVPIGGLSRDQKALVHGVMADLIAPFRPSDARQVIEDLNANGGLDAVSLSFYKHPALASDGVWDIWRLEGPAMVWHFRGAPHVHTWVNVARRAALSEAHSS